jgi:hypothetical protein
MNKVYLFKYGLSVLFLICTLTTFAQKARFSGTVVDERNLPLPGATVVVKETGQSMTTDKDGGFFYSK